MLYMHSRGNVIGMWKNLRLEKGAWYADPVFDTEDNDLGKSIGGKVERGFLKAASIGIQIAEATYNELLDCYDIVKWAFQEISIVDIGSNANALQLYDMAGEPITELKLASHLEQFKPTDTNSNNSMKQIALTTIALALGLAETATEQEVLTLAAQNKNAATELANLKLQAETTQKNEAITMVDQAISDKSISADMKDSFLKLFAADHESAKTIVAALPKPQNLVTFATQSTITPVTTTAEDAKKYEEMDRAGTILKLAKSDFNEFSRLYEAFYGSKPDKLKV